MLVSSDLWWLLQLWTAFAAGEINCFIEAATWISGRCDKPSITKLQSHSSHYAERTRTSFIPATNIHAWHVFCWMEDQSEYLCLLTNIGVPILGTDIWVPMTDYQQLITNIGVSTCEQQVTILSTTVLCRTSDLKLGGEQGSHLQQKTT